MIKEKKIYKGVVVTNRASFMVAVITFLAYGMIGPYRPINAGAAQPTATQSKAKQLPAGTPAAGGGSGKVLEVQNVSSYTYARVDTGKEKIWLAGPKTNLKVGDKVTFPQGMPMKNFKSKSLQRTFDVVYFVGRISPASAGAASPPLPSGHPTISTGKTGKETIDVSGIAKPRGGKTIAEIYKGKSSLTGKKVVLRGKVVKFTGQVMGKNWIHVKDGTGAKDTNDLTVTTKTRAKIGDTVLVRGTLVADKDYGYGYKYPLIIEDADVTVEP
jgi:hypothetical protein